MRRLLAPVVVFALLLMSAVAFAAPAGAAPQAGPRGLGSAGQEVGDAVTLFSIDGDEEGSVTVTDLTDDFEDTDEQVPSGERMVSLDVEVEADGGDVPVDPAGFNIIDSNGVLWIDIEVTRTDDKESLEAAELADGDTLEIVIPTGVDINKVIYIVDDARVLTLVDNTSGVEAGDVVDVFTTEGEESGTIVADEVFEEFEDVEPGSEPDRGFALYGVVVTAENTGAEPLAVGADSFLAVDELGTAYRGTDAVERTADSTEEFPDLETGEIEEGDEVSGFVTFVVNADFAIDYVAYIPEARFYPVIDNVSSGTADDDDSTPVADDDDGGLGRTDDDETPTTDEDAPAGDCSGVAEWEDVTVEILQDWSAAFGAIDPDNLDPDELRDSAADVEAIAEAQADSDPPAEAEELNDLLVESYEDSAGALNDLADAVEQGDDDLRLGAAATIQEIGQSFQDGEVQDSIVDLRGVCGDEVDDL